MVGRPETGEAAPYYFNYINQVSGDDPLATLEAQLRDSIPFFCTISEQESLHRYAPGKWSIRQVLNHVSDTERAFAFRALWFARGFDTPLPSYDQLISSQGADADRFSWSSHVDDFRMVRSATISFFRNLPPGAWMRRGIASDNPFTVRSLAFIIAGHLSHHVSILRKHYL